MFTKVNDRWIPVQNSDDQFGVLYSAGIWNVGTGGGRFTAPMRKELTFAKKLRALQEAGITHVELHDTDIGFTNLDIPLKNAKKLMRIIRDEGLEVSMVTANLFSRREFINGNFGSLNSKVYRSAIDYTKRMIRLGHEEFHAIRYVYWNGSQGTNCRCGQNPVEMFTRIAQCIQEIVAWEIEEYGREDHLGFAIEPKPNEPAGWGAPADVGQALAIRSMLPTDLQDFVGVNPEYCHATMAGLNPSHEIGLAAACKSLFWVHLNGSTNSPKFDEDRPFGVDNMNAALESVLALKQAGYAFPIGFDVQPYQTDSNDQQAASVAISIRNFQRCMTIIDERLNIEDLEHLQYVGDNQAIEELLNAAITGID